MTSQQSGVSASEPGWARSNDKETAPFYHANIDDRLVPETKDLLEKYSHVPRDQQSEHIHKIREQAWKIRTYPCTGIGSWLTPQLSRMPVYPEVLKRVQDGAVLMDVGTFIGHDLRKLVFDGAPSDRLYGVDIVSHFDVGYDFFRDREHFQGHFIEADIFATDRPELTALHGRVDIILISQVLHLWDWDQQVKAAEALTRFTKPGTLIIGNQVGNIHPRSITLDSLPHPAWRHDPDTFAKMWDQVGAATGTKWESQSRLRHFADMGWTEAETNFIESDGRLFEFAVRRTS